MSQKYQAGQYVPQDGSIISSRVGLQILGYFAGTPTASIASYEVGAIAIDVTNGLWYRNTGTTSSATWTVQYGAALDLSALAATAAEINGAADLSTRTVVVPAGGAAVTLPTNGGVVMIPLITANATATLPATPTAGLTFTFIFFGTAADAEDWVLTAAAFFKGGVCWLDEDSAGVEVASIYANGSSHTTFTMNNPAAGTRIDVMGDGTNWCITGMAVSADTPAFS